MISEGAVYEAERHHRALGDITPITPEDLWKRVADDMSAKPYKTPGVDVLAAARRDREQAIDTFIRTRHAIETAQLDDPEFSHDALQRFRAEAVRNTLSRHLAALHEALRENAADLRSMQETHESHEHLMALRAEADAVRRRMAAAATPAPRAPGPGLGA